MSCLTVRQNWGIFRTSGIRSMRYYVNWCLDRRIRMCIQRHLNKCIRKCQYKYQWNHLNHLQTRRRWKPSCAKLNPIQLQYDLNRRSNHCHLPEPIGDRGDSRSRYGSSNWPSRVAWSMGRATQYASVSLICRFFRIVFCSYHIEVFDIATRLVALDFFGRHSYSMVWIW